MLDLGKQLARDWRNTSSIWHSRSKFLPMLFSIVNPVSDIGLSLDKEGHLKNGCIHNQERIDPFLFFD